MMTDFASTEKVLWFVFFSPLSVYVGNYADCFLDGKTILLLFPLEFADSSKFNSIKMDLLGSALGRGDMQTPSCAEF
jgi:hypothetical protein